MPLPAHMSPNKTVDALRDSIRSHRQYGLTDDDVEALARENAAIRIQRAWRAKRRKVFLNTEFLWTDLITHARFQARISNLMRLRLTSNVLYGAYRSTAMLLCVHGILLDNVGDGPYSSPTQKLGFIA